MYLILEYYVIETASWVKEYEIKHEITIPKDIDTGDYHCQISVTDITGWQSRTSVDIKITE